MITYYIYSNETNDQVDQITATTEFDANEKAEKKYGSNDYHWSTCDQELSNAWSKTKAKINSMKHTTKSKILAALKSGNARSLSALTKLTKSTKVATRISDLRAEGHDIRNTCKHLKSGEVRSTYQLIK